MENVCACVCGYVYTHVCVCMCVRACVFAHVRVHVPRADMCVYVRGEETCVKVWTDDRPQTPQPALLTTPQTHSFRYSTSKCMATINTRCVLDVEAETVQKLISISSRTK